MGFIASWTVRELGRAKKAKQGRDTRKARKGAAVRQGDLKICGRVGAVAGTGADVVHPGHFISTRFCPSSPELDIVAKTSWRKRTLDDHSERSHPALVIRFNCPSRQLMDATLDAALPLPRFLMHV